MPWLKDVCSGHCSSVATRPAAMAESRSLARTALRSILTCQRGQEQPNSPKRLPQRWLAKSRTLSSVTFGLDLCFAAEAASFPFAGSPHLIAVLAQMTSPLGFPSLSALISLAPSLFSHSLCMISVLTLFITKVTGTVGVHSQR